MTAVMTVEMKLKDVKRKEMRKKRTNWAVKARR
jgi:hypothetical protein